MKAVKIYFVLYIVLLCELFLVILDRDEAQDAWIKQFLNNSSAYELSFIGISDIPTSENGDFHTNLNLTGLASKFERDSVHLNIELFDFKTRNKVAGTTIENGKDSVKFYRGTDIFLVSKISGGIYEIRGTLKDTLNCRAYFGTRRKLPEYVPKDVVNILRTKILSIKEEVDDEDSDFNISEKDSIKKIISVFQPMIDSSWASSSIMEFKIINKYYYVGPKTDKIKRGIKNEDPPPP